MTRVALLAALGETGFVVRVADESEISATHPCGADLLALECSDLVGTWALSVLRPGAMGTGITTNRAALVIAILTHYYGGAASHQETA